MLITPRLQSIALFFFIPLTFFLWGCDEGDLPSPLNSNPEFELLSISPSNNTLNIDITSNVTLHFSKAVSQSSVNGATFLLWKSSDGVNYQMVEGTYSFSADLTTVRFYPVGLLSADSFYIVQVIGDNSGIKSSQGETLSTTETSYFNTGSDPTNPVFSLLSTTPESSSSNIRISDRILFRFSRTVDPTTVDNTTLQVWETSDSINPQIVEGVYSFSADNTAVIFTPSNLFKWGTTYRLLVLSSTSGVQSESGDSLSSTLDRTFTTENQSTDPLYAHQWHLNNTSQSAGAVSGGYFGEDINIDTLWDTYKGVPGIVVGMVDSGIESNHPDLVDNLDLSLSFRYSDDSNNPSPDSDQLLYSYDYPHGTATAGIVGARGWNGIGTRGVAPFTTLAGINVFSAPTDENFTLALSRTNVDISSNSWGPDNTILFDDTWSLDGVAYGNANGREGKGIIYVFAAGNQRFNANTSSLHNSKYVITVSAVNADGYYSSYSNWGANVLVAAPGGEYGDTDPAIVTTDIKSLDWGYDVNGDHFNAEGNEEGDYTSTMNGTSSAAPVVSGVVALMLEANPNLTYRDVKYILATTARKNDSYDTVYWKVNGAGYDINPNYGFGVVDAETAVTKAATFTSLAAEMVTSKYSQAVSTTIPDANVTGISSSISVPDTIAIEHVDIWVNISHSRIADLEIILTSPSGTESKLTKALAYSNNGYQLSGSLSNWRFSTVRCLDESSNGNWTLKVSDQQSFYSGTLNSWSIQITGH